MRQILLEYFNFRLFKFNLSSDSFERLYLVILCHLGLTLPLGSKIGF